MSDFDKAVVAAMLKAREIGVQMLASDCEAILQAAKQSMQGEALATIETYWSPDAGWQYNLKLNKQFDSDKFCEEFESKGKVNLYTHAPDSAARIAEQDAEIARLTKELEEARKLPVGYALVPIEPTVEMLEAANSAKFHSVFDMARPIYKAMLSAAPEVALSKIGGGE